MGRWTTKRDMAAQIRAHLDPGVRSRLNATHALGDGRGKGVWLKDPRVGSGHDYHYISYLHTLKEAFEAEKLAHADTAVRLHFDLPTYRDVWDLAHVQGRKFLRDLLKQRDHMESVGADYAPDGIRYLMVRDRDVVAVSNGHTIFGPVSWPMDPRPTMDAGAGGFGAWNTGIRTTGRARVESLQPVSWAPMSRTAPNADQPDPTGHAPIILRAESGQKVGLNPEYLAAAIAWVGGQGARGSKKYPGDPLVLATGDLAPVVVVPADTDWDWGEIAPVGDQRAAVIMPMRLD